MDFTGSITGRINKSYWEYYWDLLEVYWELLGLLLGVTRSNTGSITVNIPGSI